MEEAEESRARQPSLSRASEKTEVARVVAVEWDRLRWACTRERARVRRRVLDSLESAQNGENWSKKITREREIEKDGERRWW